MKRNTVWMLLGFYFPSIVIVRNKFAIRLNCKLNLKNSQTKNNCHRGTILVCPCRSMETNRM